MPPAASPGRLDAFQFEIIRSFDGTDHLRKEWDERTIALHGTVYMSYDWCRTWWEFYGGNNELRLFLFRVNGTLVGILPIFFQRVGFGPLSIKVARLVGSNIPPKVFDPAIDPAYAGEILRVALIQLLDLDRCDLLSLGPVSSTHPSIEGALSAAEACASLASPPKTFDAGVFSVIDLPNSYDTYLKALVKKERYYLKKDEARILGDELAGKIELVKEPDELGQHFEDFAEQHARQWAHEGKAGHFGSWPNGLDYNRCLVKRLGPLGRVRLMRIVTNKGVLARQYVFAFGDRYFWELPSREIGPEWESFSLGRTGAALMLQGAIGEKIRQVEAGMGRYDYKTRLNAKEHAASTLRVVAERTSSRIRFAVFLKISAAFAVVYHKIYYKRLMPRLPVAWRRPQAKAWLVLDF